MSSLLIAGSVTYIVVKWRVVLPTLVRGVQIATLQEGATLTRNSFPTFVACVCGGVAAYVMTLQDPLTRWSRETLLSVAVIVFSIATFAWPGHDHLRIAASHLSVCMCAVAVRMLSELWVVGVILFILLHAVCVVLYCKK